MATADRTTLSPANQHKAARKILLNGGVAWFAWLSQMLLIYTLPGKGATTYSLIAAHVGILAAMAAFLWPIYLIVQQERKTL